VNHRIGWNQPPPGWGQPQLPGWAPLVDHGPRPFHAARSLGRWWWPTAAVGGFLAVLVQVLDHDHPNPGLSARGLVTVALAAMVVVLLTVHRRYGPGPLSRALAEYTVVALLATLLAAPGVGVDQPAANSAASRPARAEAVTGEDQPVLLRAAAKGIRAGRRAAQAIAGAVRWLLNLWHKADQQVSTKGEAMPARPAHSPTPFALSTWRFRI
jgi:hypothetical protein